MKKEILKKVRRWDENIGKLIVFAVTIIIAVGVLGTLAYFYNQSREKSVKLSVLSSTASNTNDIVSQGFCSSGTTTAYITYDPLQDMYGITCSSGSVQTGNIQSAWARMETCTKTLTEAGADKCYKINK